MRKKNNPRIKRVYEEASAEDGLRILVDRLWPRGLSKKKAKVDLWLKDVAPGDALRKWFGHDPRKWEEFQARYFQELEARPRAFEPIVRELAERTVTLLFGAADETHNNAVALRAFILAKAKGPRK
jgi:uncharacterized protein YeaO (DUF488 family)